MDILVGMTYAGDLNLEETWAILSNDPHAVLIDVRTEMEWNTVGVPSLEGLVQQPHFVQWNRDGGVWNEDFLEQAQAVLPDKNAPIVLLCRSGARSAAAAEALSAAGYVSAYNIIGGFEGPTGAGGGWKDTLPHGRK